MSDELKWDTEAALVFLKNFAPAGPWVLTVIPPVQGSSTTTRTFTPDEEARCKAFIDASQNRNNLYFMVNKAMGELTKKAKKTDVAEMCWLHVDIDPLPGEASETEKERILSKLRSYRLPPTIIIFSGGGYQAFWKLRLPERVDGSIETCERLEGFNRQIEADLGGDNCHNLDRIMRLPGTINMPNAKKKEKGRVPTLAYVVFHDEGTTYTLEDVKPTLSVGEDANQGMPVATARVKISANIPHIESVDGLPIRKHTKILIEAGCNPDDPSKWCDRSDLVHHVACEMVRAGLSDDVIISVLVNERFGVSAHVREEGARQGSIDRYAARQVMNAKSAVEAERPRIIVRVGELPRMLDEAEKALIRTGLPIYQQGSRLVRVIRLANTSLPGQTAESGQLKIQEVDEYWLLEKLVFAAAWKKDKLVKEEIVLVDVEPGLTFARHLCNRKGEWTFPVLNGILGTPTIFFDGRVLSQSGYDPASKLLLDTGETVFPEVSELPSKSDAEACFEKLIQPIRGFPFVPDDVDQHWRPAADEGLNKSVARSADIAAKLTGLIRRTLPTAPVFAYDAADFGTGKTLLVEIASTLVTGRPVAPTSQGKTDDEDEKKLFSLLLSGADVISIDNVERPIMGDALCSITTSHEYASRILGRSELLTVNTNCLILVTGNNLTFQSDMTRRAIVCRLDARTERPDQRKFDFDALEEVRANRGQLVTDALTILKAYIVAGRPLQGKLKPMGKFEAWTLVREALVWLGQPDPQRSQEQLMRDDPAKAQLREVQLAWNDVFSLRRATAAEAIDRAREPTSPEDRRLGLALAAICPKGELNAKSLGRWFKRNSDRIVDGLRFIRFEDKKHGATIQLLGGSDQSSLSLVA